MLFWFEFPVGIQTILVNCTSSVKGFYAIKEYMQLSILPFVGLIVMHMYVGTSELHQIFVLLNFYILSLILTTDHE